MDYRWFIAMMGVSLLSGIVVGALVGYLSIRRSYNARYSELSEKFRIYRSLYDLSKKNHTKRKVTTR